MTNNTKIILIGLVIILSLMGIIIGNHSSFEDDLEALKPTKRETKVQLSVLNHSDDKLLNAVINNIKSGDKLGFKISANLPIYVSLLVSINHQQPEILLKNARIPPGKNKRLDNNGMEYQYEYLADHQNLKFCIIHEENAKDLRQNLLKIKDTWLNIPKPLCALASKK